MHRRAGIERELASRADQRVLRLFTHVERMDEYRMARRVWMEGMGMDGVKVALGSRWMMEGTVRQCTRDRMA